MLYTVIMINTIYENYNKNWSSDSEWQIMTPSLFAKNNLFYVQEAGKFDTLPGYFAEREGLHSFLLLSTISGKGLLRYKEREYPLQSGDTFWIDCMQRHSYRTDSDWKFYFLHFSGNSSAGFYKLWEDRGPIVSAGISLEEKIADIMQWNRTPSPGTELRTSQVISQALTDILLASTQLAAPPESAPDYLLRILRYIDQHFAENITLQELSALFGANPVYISSEFKRWFGIHYRTYLIGKRLSRAKELLKYSDFSVAAISDEVGFPSPSYMIETFRTREGMTPLQYRKLWQR